MLWQKILYFWTRVESTRENKQLCRTGGVHSHFLCVVCVVGSSRGPATGTFLSLSHTRALYCSSLSHEIHKFATLSGKHHESCSLTGEEKPRKNLTQETCPDRGSNPGPLRDRRAFYCLSHSDGHFF